MKNTLSRRDFLKLTGVGLGTLAFNPFKMQHMPLALPQFPAGDRLGRVFGKTDIHSEPNFGAPSVKTLYDDDVVVWQHSLMYLKKAVDLNKQLDYFVYPGHLHNVRGKDRVHLMTKISNYFIDNL